MMVVLTELLHSFLNSFDFIPSLLRQYTVLMEQFPAAAVILAAVLAGGPVWVAVKKPSDESRMGLALMHALAATIAMMIAVGQRGYRYQGIFSTFELFTVWGAPVFAADCIWFSLPQIIRSFQQKKTAKGIVLAVLGFPLCLAGAVASAKYIGIPVFKAVIGLIMKDFFREAMTPVCIRVSFYAGLLVYFVSIPSYEKFQHLPQSLLIVAAASTVACFYPAFIAFVIVLGGLGWILNTFGETWDHSSPAEKVSMSGSTAYLSAEEESALEGQLTYGGLSKIEVRAMKRSVAAHGALNGTDQHITKVKTSHYYDD